MSPHMQRGRRDEKWSRAVVGKWRFLGPGERGAAVLAQRSVLFRWCGPVRGQYGKWSGPMKTSSRGGFSLIEMIVVMAIIAALLAISLPAINQMRQSARRVQCANNLKQIGLGLQNHQTQVGFLPKDGVNGWGYAVYLMPQVEQLPLFEQLKPFQNSIAAGSPVQVGLTDTVIQPYICPSFQKEPNLDSGFGRLSYRGNSQLLNKKKMQFSDVSDGESSTIAVAETTSDLAWAFSATGAGSTESQHGAGSNVVMCDGSVRWISNNVSASVLSALFSISGKDVVGEF